MREYIKNELGNVVGIRDDILIIAACDNAVADAIIKKYHYSHKVTKNRFASFSINGDMGYMQLGYGIRPHIKILPDISHDNFCEFDRMWVSDAMPKFTESRAIGLLLKLIPATYPEIKYMITYADESAGNSGVIYKATNAFILPPIICDFYLLPNGERVHPVSMWHRHKTRAKKFLETQYPGIKHIRGKFPDGPFQRRFLYILDKWARKKFIVDTNK